MAIEDLIGSLASVGAQRYGIDTQRYGIDTERYKFDQSLPLQYGELAARQYAPMYGYGQSQGGNMAQLGGQAMGLYGSLANQQAGMYQSELPFMAEQAKFNALAPVLQGLLGGVGMGDFKIPNINYSFQRPDVMAGYQGAVNNAYTNARAYDDWMNSNFAAQGNKMPAAPKVAPAPPTGGQQANPPVQAKPMPMFAYSQPRYSNPSQYRK